MRSQRAWNSAPSSTASRGLTRRRSSAFFSLTRVVNLRSVRVTASRNGSNSPGRTTPSPSAVRVRPAPDRVARRFEAAGPNRLWVADVTCVPTRAGFLCLAVVLDVFSRRVVGWAMAAHLRTALVTGALEMAVKQRRPAAVIHHSDQGCQYTSPAFGARCQEWGVTPSTGSVGDCFDNAMAESFFATLECELLDRTKWATHAEARSAVFTFIEGWYNTRRRHSALGYLSPLDFERLRETAPADGDRSGEAPEPAGRFASGAPAPAGVVTGVAAGNTGRA